jgi:uncharacterized tellurite resistance protein B-like protein
MTIEESLREAIGDALVKDKTLCFVLARELGKSPEFRQAVFAMLDPEIVARQLVLQIIEHDGSQRRAVGNSIKVSPILSEAKQIATQRLAEIIEEDIRAKMSRDTETI